MERVARIQRRPALATLERPRLGRRVEERSHGRGEIGSPLLERKGERCGKWYALDTPGGAIEVIVQWRQGHLRTPGAFALRSILIACQMSSAVRPRSQGRELVKDKN